MTRKRIGFAIAAIGLAIAIVTPDGCKNEMVLRFIGVAMFAVGALLCKAFDFQKGGAK